MITNISCFLKKNKKKNTDQPEQQIPLLPPALLQEQHVACHCSRVHGLILHLGFSLYTVSVDILFLSACQCCVAFLKVLWFPLNRNTTLENTVRFFLKTSNKIYLLDIHGASLTACMCLIIQLFIVN